MDELIQVIRFARKKLRESNADLMIANDIGTRYRKNSDYNNVILINSKNIIQSGWKKKSEISKFIRKTIEKLV